MSFTFNASDGQGSGDPRFAGLLQKMFNRNIANEFLFESTNTLPTVIWFKCTDTIAQAFAELVANDILSAPVYDLNERFMGFVDMLQLTQFASSLCEEEKKPGTWTEEWFNQRSAFKMTTLTTLFTHFPPEFPPLFVREFASVWTAFEILLNSGAHRINVQGSFGDTLGIITQTSMIRFVSREMDLNIMNAPVSDMRPFTALISINSKARALSALKLMTQYRVSGIAVTNDEGELIDEISIRDLKGLSYGLPKFQLLWKTVADFMAASRDMGPHRYGWVYPYSTVGDVISLMATNGFHRVFVTVSKNNMKCIDVITQTDILKYLKYCF